MGGLQEGAQNAPAQVVSLVSEVFFREKIEDVVHTLGNTIDHRFCNTLQELNALPQRIPKMIILDLDHPQAFKTLEQFQTQFHDRIIAFGPYMNDELRIIAKTFGITVYCRSEFFDQLHLRLRPYSP